MAKKNKLAPCNQPPGVSPPVLVSCIYEFVAFMDCLHGHTAQNADICSEATGWIDTLTDSGSEYIQCIYKKIDPNKPVRSIAPTNLYPTAGPVGKPYSFPHLVGRISNTNWNKIKILRPGDPNHLPIPLNQWVRDDLGNRTYKKHRWVMLKYYKEFLFWLTKEQLETYNCPDVLTFNDYPPQPLQATYAALGVRCPNYYELEPCVDCSGWKSGIDKIYIETAHTFNITPGSILQHPANPFNQPRDPGPFTHQKRAVNSWPHCYGWAKLPKGPGGLVKRVVAGTPIVVDNSDVTFVDNTRFDQSVVEYKDCTTCLQDFIIAVNHVGRADGCSKASDINNYPANAVAINQCIIDAKMTVRRVRADAYHKAFFALHGNHFYYHINGQCVEVVVATCPDQAVKTLTGYGIRKVGGVNQAYWNNGVPFYFNFYNLAARGVAIYPDVCDCGRHAGAPDIGVFDPICFPPIAPPTITRHPFDPTNRHVRIKGGVLTISVRAIGPGPLRYQWYKNGTALAGQNNSNLVINNPQVGDSGNYHCVVSNGGGKRLNRVQSKIGRLTVMNGPTKLYPPNQVIYRIKVDRWRIVAQAAFGCQTAPISSVELWSERSAWGLKMPWPKGREKYFGPLFVTPGGQAGKTYIYKVTSVRKTTWGALPNSMKDLDAIGSERTTYKLGEDPGSLKISQGRACS